MFEIFLYNGGIYRFDELKEAVEDLGGMMFKRNILQISRGSSFLSEEVQVMIIIPEEDEEAIRTMTHELKGHLEKLDVDEKKKKEIFTYISVCDALNKSGKWMSRDEIEEEIECPCPAKLCNHLDVHACVHEFIDEILVKYCKNEVLTSRKKDVIEYYLSEVE